MQKNCKFLEISDTLAYDPLYCKWPIVTGLGDMSLKFHEACNCKLELSNSYNHIVTKYAFLMSGSISHDVFLRWFPKPNKTGRIWVQPRFWWTCPSTWPPKTSHCCCYKKWYLRVLAAFPRCNNLDIGSFLPAKCGVTNGQMGRLTQVSSWKSWLKPPRKLLIILMYSLTDVWLFYHYSNHWAPVYRLYITIPMWSNVIPSTQWDPQRLLQSSHLQLMLLPDGQGHHPGMQLGRLLRRRILYIWFQSRLLRKLRIWNI